MSWWRAPQPTSSTGLSWSLPLGRGGVGVFLASDQKDARASVLVGGRGLKTDSLIGKVDTNYLIDINSDAPVAAGVQGGEKLRCDVTIVTAGNIRAVAVWVGVRR